MFADLHIHSWYSSGTLSPAEIAAAAKREGLGLISICDHNELSAYGEIVGLCAANRVQLIPGVEIHTLMNGAEYHLLAYGFEMRDAALHRLLEYNRETLAAADTELIGKAAADYQEISLPEFLKYERNRANGGWKSLDYLKNKGLIDGMPDYLKFAHQYNISPAENFPHPEEVIRTVHNAGGYAVLAHLADSAGPSTAACEKAALSFTAAGIDGFECYYPSFSAEMTDFLAAFCRRRNLLITGGSDEHGGFNNIPDGVRYCMGSCRIMIEQLELKNLFFHLAHSMSGFITASDMQQDKGIFGREFQRETEFDV